MKNIINPFTSKTWRGKAIVIAFFFSACMNDEILVPSNQDAVSDGVITQSTRHSSQSAREQRNFTAHLSGGQEIPAVDSKGTGQAIFKLSEDGTTLYYKLIVANIENVTQAHIHCGSSMVSRGPVVAFLFGFNAAGVDVNGVLAEGSITNADIIVRPDTEDCVGGLATFENLLEKMRNGDAYVNVHTIENPSGEIRGQIK